MKKSFCWLKSEITLHMADPQFRMPLFIDPNHYTYTHKLFSFVFKVKSDSRASAKPLNALQEGLEAITSVGRKMLSDSSLNVESSRLRWLLAAK